MRLKLFHFLAIAVLAPFLRGALQSNVSIPSPLTVSSSMALPQATALSAYSAGLSLAGCFSPWIWSVAPGSTLPGGLSISAAGQLAGALSNGGNYSFSVQASCGGTFAITAPVTLKGAHVVALTWSAASGAAGYNIYRGTKSGGESSTPLNSSPVTGTAWTDASVTPGATYFYVAKSVGPSGSLSSASTETSAKVASP